MLLAHCDKTTKMKKVKLYLQDQLGILMKVLQISKKDTIQLKKNLGKSFVASSQFEDEDDDFHLGGFVDGQLVTTASFHLERNPLIKEENQFCLDEVITDPQQETSQMTKELLQMAFPMMKRNFTNIVWCSNRLKNTKILQELDFKPLLPGDDAAENSLMVKNL